MFAENNTLGGNVGTSDGNSINSVEISTGVTVAAGSNQINASTISIGAGSSLTSAALISGGDNADEGATLADTNISLVQDSSLILNEGASLYAAIDGALDSSGAITINTTFNSSNSRINIGGDVSVALVTLSDNVTLDVSGNNGSVKASSIIIGGGSTLKLGDGEIVGTIQGSGNDVGTLDIQGDVTLDGQIGGGDAALHLLNIGTKSEPGYSVSAQDSITATSVTLNGGLTSLSIANGKIITSDVFIADNAKLSVGDGSQVTGLIRGDVQGEGVLEVRSLSTFTAQNDIGSEGYDLNQIIIYGNLDLSSGDGFSANGQIISLFDGASLKIGSKIVTGDIRGYGAEFAATNGVGKGNVIFAANNEGHSGSIGASNGYAINELEILESVVVSNSSSINAAHITLNGSSSLTSSADLISGGNNEDDTGLASTAVTLNSGAALTLDGVDLFLGTIDGNLDDDSSEAQGALTLTGAYGDDDIISIGGIKKLSSITISDNSSLDVRANSGVVRASEITLGENSFLSVGQGALAGVINGSADKKGTLNISGDTSINSLVGVDHSLLAININNIAAVTANQAIKAETITISDAGFGVYSSLTLAEDVDVTADIILDTYNLVSLGNNSQVIGKIQGSSKNSGGLAVQENASVIANGNIGANDRDLFAVVIYDGASLDLATNNSSLAAQSIALIGDATLAVGSASLSGEILGYDNLNEHGSGKGSIIFTDNNTINGNIGNYTGKALDSITVNAGKTVNSNGASLYVHNINLESNEDTGSTLNVSGIVGGGDGLDGITQVGTSLKLYGNSTLILSDGAAFKGNVDGIAGEVHTGNVEIANSTLVNSSNIDIGSSFKLAQVKIGESATLDLGVYNNILKADLISIKDEGSLTLGSGAVAGIIDGFTINTGKVNVNNAKTYGSEVTFGSSNGLAELNFNGGGNFDVSNSIKSSTVKINNA